MDNYVCNGAVHKWRGGDAASLSYIAIEKT